MASVEPLHTANHAELTIHPSGLVSGIGGEIIRELGPYQPISTGLPLLRENWQLTDEEILLSQRPALAV